MSEKTETSSELAPWEQEEPVGMAAIAPTPELVQQAYRAIKFNEVPPEVGDPEIVARLILERIERGSFDESMQPAETLTAWGDLYLDQTVVVYGFHLNKSTIENAEGEKGVYAVVELAQVGTGEMMTVSIGGRNVLMQLVKAWEEGRFPFPAKLIAKPTGTPGRKTYWLQDPNA